MSSKDLPLTVLRGLLLMCVAVLLFAVSDVIGKHLAMLLPVPLIMAVRYLVSFLLIAATLGPRHGRKLWQTNRTGLVLLRSLCLACASLTMGLALRYLPLGETVAIIFLSPFAVLLLAGPVLGEKVRAISWVSAAISFAGVLMIMRPGSGLDLLGVAFALTNAGLATVYNLLTRKLTRTETTAALMFHTMLTGMIVFAPLAVITFAGADPKPMDLILMVLLGGLATSGHFLFTTANRLAPAPSLAPITYMHLAWATILGWLVFDHFPDVYALIGIAAILVSGVGVTLLSRPKTLPDLDQ